MKKGAQGHLLPVDGPDVYLPGVADVLLKASDGAGRNIVNDEDRAVGDDGHPGI
jgi:hypothetical protein